MSYLNPLLAFGYEALAERATEVGVSGFIVPDLPYEESAPLAAALERARLGARTNGDAGHTGRAPAAACAPRARASSTP